MHAEPQKTQALKLPAAMPVRTLSVEITEGSDRGARWEGDQGTFGTAADTALGLKDETVSGYHMRLTAADGGVRVSDLGSTNGSFVGDVRIEHGTVPPGSMLRLGRTMMLIGAGAAAVVELHDEDRLGELRGQTQTMRRLMTQVRRAAQSNVAVLLIGESGTGKELLARAVHDASPRAQAPFVTVDCGAITPSLVASELFGHEKGSFTGATHTKIGAFERANTGTLFLDEVGELPPELQSNLLGALERRRFCRVGGQKEVSVDLRVVAATNRDLRANVNAGRFRLDLYYRLAVVTLDVPPLRERAKDIPLLVAHFAAEEDFDGPLSALISDATMTELLAYRWPGNVRELRNYVQATVAMGHTPLPGLDAPEPSGSELEDLRSGFASLDDLPYGEARTALLHEFEVHYLAQRLKRSGGNVTQAARDAGMARSHLNEIIRRHGIR